MRIAADTVWNRPAATPLARAAQPVDPSQPDLFDHLEKPPQPGLTEPRSGAAVAPETLTRLIAELRAYYAADARTAVFEVRVELRGSKLAFVGETTEPEAARVLMHKVTQWLGDSRVIDAIERLPGAHDAAEVATVRSAQVTLYGEPRFSAGVLTRYDQGTQLTVLSTRGTWLRVRGENGDDPRGYLGWVHRGFLTQPTLREAGIAQGTSTPVEVGAAGSSSAGAAEAVVAEALNWVGTPYDWGGTTRAGVDCSGLVQRAYATQGIKLPRDADQQAGQGQAVNLDLDLLRPGDLVFFAAATNAQSATARRIKHVAMVIAGSRIVHASAENGAVAENDLKGGSELERDLRASMVAVRRIIPEPAAASPWPPPLRHFELQNPRFADHDNLRQVIKDYPHRPLGPGLKKNPGLAAVQRRFIEWGLLKPGSDDGTWGPKTASAVVEFQKIAGRYYQDLGTYENAGRIDSATLAAIDAMTPR